jgi:hypothetical protein
MPASYCGLADTMEFTSRSGAVRHRTALAKSRSLVTGCGSFYSRHAGKRWRISKRFCLAQ